MKYYSINEVAEICGMNRKTITSEIKKGHLVAKRRIGRYWVEETDLKNWDDRNNNSTLKNAVVAPGSSDLSKLSGPRPDDNMPQAEIEPNSANTSAEPAGSGQEKEDDTETTKNAEKLVEYWNLYSPNPEPVATGGHLHQPIKRKAEKLMVVYNNDLKHCFLSIKIHLYFYEEKSPKARKPLTLKQYIDREHHIIFTFPKLTPEEEKELATAMSKKLIQCRHCGQIDDYDGPIESGKLFNPLGLLEKPQCSNPKCRGYDLVVSNQPIGPDDIPHHIAKIFYNKYRSFLEEGDWPRICDLYNIRKEIYYQQ